MSGNVKEWCWDWYDQIYYASSPTTDPKGPSNGWNRSHRGGCWDYPANFLRVTFRDSGDRPVTRPDIGFRPVRNGPPTPALSIGDTYAGGIIFYLDGSGGGLVAAPSDQSSDILWGGHGTYIEGTSTDVGTGAANTTAIVDRLGSGTYAARICYDLPFNGYSDWFLPSREELNLMHQNLHQAGIGDFVDDYYWSSSDYNPYSAWHQNFDNGHQVNANKYNNNDRVRAVRAFPIPSATPTLSSTPIPTPSPTPTPTLTPSPTPSPTPTPIPFTLEAINDALANLGLDMFLVLIIDYGTADTYQLGNREAQMTLTSYALSETEVTQGDYEIVMGYNPAYGHSQEIVGDTLPVYNVTWYFAVRFCNALSTFCGFEEIYDEDSVYTEDTWEADFTKKGFYLPIEAQWEYAYGGPYHFDYPLGDIAIRSDYVVNDTIRAVKGKPANGYGLYNVGGNLSEWCHDWYGSDYPHEGETDPIGPLGGAGWNTRVIRGENHLSNNPRNYQQRSSRAPLDKMMWLGFRVSIGGFGKW